MKRLHNFLNLCGLLFGGKKKVCKKIFKMKTLSYPSSGVVLSQPLFDFDPKNLQYSVHCVMHWETWNIYKLHILRFYNSRHGNQYMQVLSYLNLLSERCDGLSIMLLRDGLAPSDPSLWECRCLELSSWSWLQLSIRGTM